MNHFQQSVAKRSSNKLATTNLTNEIVDALNALATGTVGSPSGSGILSAVLARVDSALDGKGQYSGTIMLGPLRADGTSDIDLTTMDDGASCVLLNQGELGSSDPKWIPTGSDTPTFVLAWLIGITKKKTDGDGDDSTPVVMTNYNKAIRRLRVRVVGTTAYVEYSYSNDGDDWTLLFTGTACS